jgi:hypothetical protein
MDDQSITAAGCDSTNPLALIDAVLGQFSLFGQADPELEQQEELFGRLCDAILRASLGENYRPNTNPVQALFNKASDKRARKLGAVTLLRLLAANDSLFGRQDFRVKSFQLFDEELVNDIYPQLGLDTRQQPFEKMGTLKSVAPSIEAEIGASVNSLETIQGLASYRHKIMRIIHSPKFKTFVCLFLPPSLLESRLDELFRSLEEYLSLQYTDPEVSLGQAEVSQKLIEKYIAESENFGTKYSIDLLGGLGRKLLALLKQDIALNPLTMPANVSVRAADKKYPLESTGLSFNLKVVIENEGPGYALNLTIAIEEITSVRSGNTELYLGRLKPGSIVVDLPVTVESPTDSVLAVFRLNWINGDQSKQEHEEYLTFAAQRADVPWEAIRSEDPYNLDPAETEQDLVGRSEILGQLSTQVLGKTMSSSYLHGQKRVGKTSIVRTLKTNLEQTFQSDYSVLYLESGDYIHPDARRTVENLGRRICQRVIDEDARFKAIDIPEFDGALSPLSEFLDNIHRIAPDFKVLIVLDEFDELPLELYKRGDVGDSFFLALRTISNKSASAFILVGGERLELVLSRQGDRLNKFLSYRVDYFDREQHWSDFQDLVRRPVTGWLEIVDGALEGLYEQTAGNPYFTKLICRSMFRLAVSRRDAYVTRREVDEAARITLRTVTTNSFQHFWEDGILEVEARAEGMSINRRKCLLALAEAIRDTGVAQHNDLLKRCVGYDLSAGAMESELRDFERRQVLVRDGECYTFKVPFFSAWLVETGIREIVTQVIDHDAHLKFKQTELSAYVADEEISSLIDGWGLYHGQRITKERVRSWLQQFATDHERRLIFKILQHTTLYSDDAIRSKLRTAHGIINRGLVQTLEAGRRKRADIVVSYLDGPAKSGAWLAKLYADENEIYSSNVVERSKLCAYLAGEERTQALVFIDDFVGTGDSVSDYFKELKSEAGEQLNREDLRIFFVALTGFSAGIEKIDDVLKQLDLPVKFHVCDPLSDADKCFADDSHVFITPEERSDAADVAFRYGGRLVRNAPLGYGDSQATIVFSHNCPNNSLPILWAETKEWKPLFRRV